MDMKIPVAADRAPNKAYSVALMRKICLRLAPKVLNKTLSLIRWYLLNSKELNNTIKPVKMLNAAINWGAFSKTPVGKNTKKRVAMERNSISRQAPM